MKKTFSHITEDSTPNAEFLIKSISEQGYTLETSLADLIDNSISAGATEIEILIDAESTPFTLFLSDNGSGMTEKELARNMKFPSSSPEANRKVADLGRFGLGMKTASFAQTRCFTVMSRKSGDIKFSGRTWDVDYLKDAGAWHVLVNSDDEIESLLDGYQMLSRGFLNEFEQYKPNTIIVWQGLHKFESYVDAANSTKALKRQLTEVTAEYLSLVFHRFLERKSRPVKIRINNVQISPFNPFPSTEPDVRPLEIKQRTFNTDLVKLEGFILPVRSIEESKNGSSVWATKNRGLMDMEGIYIYRSDRIILFGGWNGIIKKTPRLQLARLRVDVGNSIDHLLHLNVAKSQIAIPYELTSAFLRYISELRTESEKEFLNRGLKSMSVSRKSQAEVFFNRIPSSKGMLYEVNERFPLIESLSSGLTAEQASTLSLILRMVNTTINKLRHVHEDKVYIDADSSGPSKTEIVACVENLKNSGFSASDIKDIYLVALGYRLDSLPKDILDNLN